MNHSTVVLFISAFGMEPSAFTQLADLWGPNKPRYLLFNNKMPLTNLEPIPARSDYDAERGIVRMYHPTHGKQILIAGMKKKGLDWVPDPSFIDWSYFDSVSFGVDKDNTRLVLVKAKRLTYPRFAMWHTQRFKNYKTLTLHSKMPYFDILKTVCKVFITVYPTDRFDWFNKRWAALWRGYETKMHRLRKVRADLEHPFPEDDLDPDYGDPNEWEWRNPRVTDRQMLHFEPTPQREMAHAQQQRGTKRKLVFAPGTPAKSLRGSQIG